MSNLKPFTKLLSNTEYTNIYMHRNEPGRMTVKIINTTEKIPELSG